MGIVTPCFQLQIPIARRIYHDITSIYGCINCRWIILRIILKSDSEVAAAIVNKGTTRCPIIMEWLWELFWLSEYYDFHLIVDHIPGSLNVIADSISRLDETCHQDTLRAWLSQSSSSTIDLSSHMSPLSLAFLRPRGSVEIGYGSS